MIGGPFTQQAAGGDLGELSAEGIVAGQQAASTPIPLDPSYQAPPDTSRPQYAGGGIRVVPRELNPNRAYSAQEFYPGQERPNESRASGGDPIFAASSGRIPWGILADSANQVKRQRADLMKMVQGNTDQFKGVAAPPYDIAYQNYVTDEYNKFKQARADALHGGDLDAATRELYTNPQANEEFQAFNRNLLAYGNANKYQFDQVADLLEKQRTGEEFVSPDTLEYAQRFMGGKMPFDDKATLGERAYDTQVLDRKISRDKLWDTVYLPRLKQEMDTLQAEGKVITKGGRSFLSETETRSLDRMKEQVVKDMVHKYGLDSEDEVRRFVDANTPRYEVTDLSQLSLGSSGGSQAQRPRVGSPELTVDAAIPRIGGGTVRSWSVVDKDGKPFTETFQVATPNGKNRNMTIDRIVADAHGKLWVAGRDPSIVDVSVEDAAKVESLAEDIKDIGSQIDAWQKGSVGPTDGAAFREQQPREIARLKAERDKLISKKTLLQKKTTKTAEEFATPFALNEGRLRTTLGDDQIDMIISGAKEFGSRTAASAPKGAARVDPADEWERVKAANPKMTDQQVTDAVKKKLGLK